ncbi:unnamed protein product [Kuraishia capsulata CBS 1993]|uniref:RRM domain-containing protein n=1 Tax=Kuraishia capsulata CBS 1993 TaxID=1382522 RepID=W6MFB6_9ASCO|nr:uncharacterized protein KUCA_T00000156001 [Kuraishia capsulata CBS 1993]CDK24196.1 unnamed protein product [Kuraishia capsulata CBS 1993]
MLHPQFWLSRTLSFLYSFLKPIPETIWSYFKLTNTFDSRLKESLRRLRDSTMRLSPTRLSPSRHSPTRPSPSRQTEGNIAKKTVASDRKKNEIKSASPENLTAHGHGSKSNENNSGILATLSLNRPGKATFNKYWNHSKKVNEPVTSCVDEPKEPENVNFDPPVENDTDSNSDTSTSTVIQNHQEENASTGTHAFELISSDSTQVVPLHIGNLHKSVTEQQILDLFSAVAPIISARVCKDSVSGDSLGYAYINVANSAYAEKIMSTLNYSTVSGREIRITPSIRDKTKRSTIGANVFISDLPCNITSKMLSDMFESFGVWSCKADNVKRHGFVHFRNKADAYKVVDLINSGAIFDTPATAAIHISKTDRSHLPAFTQSKPRTVSDVVVIPPPAISLHNINDHRKPKENLTIFIRNLPLHTSESSIRVLVAGYDTVTSILSKYITSRDATWALVTFGSKNGTLNAIKHLDGSKYCGKRLTVELAVPLEEKRYGIMSSSTKTISPLTLLVNNLDMSLGKRELFMFCCRFGHVLKVKVFNSRAGGIFKAVNYGYITMADAESTARVYKNIGELGAKAYIVNVSPSNPNQKTQPIRKLKNGHPPVFQKFYESPLSATQVSLLDEFRVFVLHSIMESKVEIERQRWMRSQVIDLLTDIAYNHLGNELHASSDFADNIAILDATRIAQEMLRLFWDYEELFHLAVECPSVDCQLRVKLLLPMIETGKALGILKDIKK